MSGLEEPCRKLHRVIGYWMADKKILKMKWSDFGKVCRSHGYHIVKLDLSKPLEEQGPFTVILHKLSGLIVQNDEKVSSKDDSWVENLSLSRIMKKALSSTFFSVTLGNEEFYPLKNSIAMVQRVETYIRDHPEVIVIDPLDNVRKLLDRSHCYSIIQSIGLEKYDVFTPTFIEFTSSNTAENLKKLKAANVTFPIVCKTSVSHGSNECHKMAVIFNEQGLADCELPCVAQSFINHNAVLRKLYVIGDEYQMIERPSLKNFQPSASQKTIFFNAHDVSKAGSTSSLCVLDAEDVVSKVPTVDKDKMDTIVSIIRKSFGLSLFGIDVIVSNDTGRYFIIDINSYPGYEGFQDFFDRLMQLIIKTVDEHEMNKTVKQSLPPLTSLSSSPHRYSYKSCENSDHSGTVSPMDSDIKFIQPNPSHITNRSDQDDSGFDTSDSSDEKKCKYRPSPCVNQYSNLGKPVSDQCRSKDSKQLSEQKL